jgi:hypothetical protein
MVDPPLLITRRYDLTPTYACTFAVTLASTTIQKFVLQDKKVLFDESFFNQAFEDKPKPVENGYCMRHQAIAELATR